MEVGLLHFSHHNSQDNGRLTLYNYENALYYIQDYKGNKYEGLSLSLSL